MTFSRTDSVAGGRRLYQGISSAPNGGKILDRTGYVERSRRKKMLQQAAKAALARKNGMR